VAARSTRGIEILAPIKVADHVQGAARLATFGEKRPTGLPDVPTASETGGALKGLQIASWNALAAPAKTPPAIIERLNHECQVALASPDLKKEAGRPERRCQGQLATGTGHLARERDRSAGAA
jgi:tripartite-type tricarboxylate transporter receptor subunit TctC